MTVDHKPLRILLWSHGGCGTHYFGPGSFNYRMYCTAEPGRFEITLVHASQQQAEHDLFARQYDLGPLDTNHGSMIARRRSLRSYLKRAERFLDQHHEEFDVMHGLTGFHPVVVPAHYAEQRGVPAVIFLTVAKKELGRKSGLKRLLGYSRKRRKIAKNLSSMVAMSQQMRDELDVYGFARDKVAPIPMGVDTTHYRPTSSEDEMRDLRKKLGWPDRPTLVFSGRIIDRKQPHLLVQALGMLRAENRDCQLALIGPYDSDPEYTKKVQTLAKQNDVADDIIWAGFIDDPAEMMRAGDIYSLPSKSEGMPAALVEAMASALPGIVTDISGCRDLIDDGRTGFIIEPTAKAIAEVWRRYLDDSTLLKQHATAARKFVEQVYSMKAVLDQYEALFRRVITEKNETSI